MARDDAGGPTDLQRVRAERAAIEWLRKLQVSRPAMTRGVAAVRRETAAMQGAGTASREAIRAEPRLEAPCS